MGLKQLTSKVIAFFLVIAIISIIIFSGPAQAFVLSLSIPDANVIQGEKVKVDLKVDTQNSDNPSDIKHLIFKMSGPENNSENFSCEFSPDGKIISGCDGIDITKVKKIESGYCKSYGYGYGCSFEYTISIDTMFFEVGTYKTSLIITAKDKDTIKNGEDIVINIPPKVCSVRANKGDVSIDEMQFVKDKVSFYLPLNNAERGQGYITGQDGRERLTFRFKVDKILVYSNQMIKANVTGKYRIGGFGELTQESGILTFDRVNNVTSFVGSHIQMSGMKVYFRKFC